MFQNTIVTIYFLFSVIHNFNFRMKHRFAKSTKFWQAFIIVKYLLNNILLISIKNNVTTTNAYKIINLFRLLVL
jgi:hypothetical protein